MEDAAPPTTPLRSQSENVLVHLDIAPEPTLLIVGAGHVAQPLAMTEHDGWGALDDRAGVKS
jgi:hypothetical protein